MSLADDLKTEARRLGFDLVGIAPAAAPGSYAAFGEWLDRGFAGEMQYLPNRREAYAHPDSVLEGVRSVVMLGMNYRTTEPAASVQGSGRVSRYAWGERDYHDLIRERLEQLKAFLASREPTASIRGVIDTAPLLERDFARLAGLGWFGKNTLLINKHMGSWFFLAALLTDISLDPDAAHTASHCGTCTRCLDACPTDAFVAPYELDARRCISYLTIELRGPIPMDLRAGIGEWIFGCDVCQDVCPWNRKAPQSVEPSFAPRSDLRPLDARELLSLDTDAFRARFRHTPLARPKRAGVLRNAAIVLGNQRDRSAVSVLVERLDDAEPVIRGACAWALGQIGGAREALQFRLGIETDGSVRHELEAALAVAEPARAQSPAMKTIVG
ncbi:MAG TPA: tRNA epoxyqueuosine(34) reductase QueG [Planctomycetaceae bacterium]|nr:tRNA epoxyqueuosine(34) reductase QueG [Planctomycetaceae bacterium]